MIDTALQNQDIIMGVLALAAMAFFLYNGGDVSRLFGPRTNLFNPIRRAFIPIIDKYLSQYGGYAETNVYEREYAGTYRGTLEELEQALYDSGYLRYPVASIATTPDGRSETASWARHDHFFAKRQNHARIMDSNPEVEDSRGWDLYVHNEYSAHNPLTMRKHYRGQGMKFREGIEMLHRHLEGTDVELEWESTKGKFEPPLRNDIEDDEENEA